MEELQKARLEEYLKAERAILVGQEYTIGDRVLRRADLKAVQSAIQSLMDELNAGSRAGCKRVVFI